MAGITIDGLWAGTEASLEAYLAIMEKSLEFSAGGITVQHEDDDDRMPEILQVRNGIGVISIAGPLTNTDSWINRLMGLTSYDSIREALIYAAQAADITRIVLHIDSPGGAVNGVADTAKLISMIDSDLKPVYSFSDGLMASAAYWIGSSARKVFASEVATVGSIGVITTHMERSKQLKEAGVTPTVLRAGKYKALANSVEPLTEVAKKEIQSKLDAMYKIFVQHVAEARGHSYDYTDENMAQGREFLGASAEEAGLIDGVMSFDKLLSKLENESIDNRSHLSQTTQKSIYGANNMTKKALTEQQIAAIAAGASVAASTETDNPEVTPEAQAAAAAEAEAQAAAEAEAANASQAEAEAAAEVTENKDETNVVAFLQTQIKERDDSLVEARVENATLKAKVAEQETTHSALVAIAAASVNNMRVAMGGSPVDMSSMNAAAVLAEHEGLSAQFNSKFKAGGVAAVDIADAELGNKPVVDGTYKARIAAVGGTTAKKAK